jgi:hypothetical protein
MIISVKICFPCFPCWACFDRKAGHTETCYPRKSARSYSIEWTGTIQGRSYRKGMLSRGFLPALGFQKPDNRINTRPNFYGAASTKRWGGSVSQGERSYGSGVRAGQWWRHLLGLGLVPVARVVRGFSRRLGRQAFICTLKQSFQSGQARTEYVEADPRIEMNNRRNKWIMDQ